MASLRDAITDVPGIRVGHWTDRRAATGCTVVLCPPGSVGGVDVRGAAPGTRETEVLRPGNLVSALHAVVLSGGSAYGLDAASGVMRYLEERGVGFAMGELVVPIVPAAVLFDLGLGNGRRRPDAEAGYRAARSATRGAVAEGTVGAGTGATVAKVAGPERRLKGGLGTASEVLETGVVVGALVAVNAVGAIRDPDSGEWVAAPRGEAGAFLDPEAIARTGRRWVEPGAAVPDGGLEADTGENTTIAVVATNVQLTSALANRLATVCHDALARTTWPAHTQGDGDTIFAVATGAVELELGGYGAVEAMTARALERAVLRGVQLATGLAGVPSAGEWRKSR